MNARTSRIVAVLAVCLAVAAVDSLQAADVLRLPAAEYRDRMAAGWIGQMVGVGWGGPTEFKYNGRIIPEDKMPAWKPSMVNQFHQDDIYVEMTFLRSMEEYGLDVPIRQAGIDFANSGYRLWHANRAGRDNLRAGIAPPDSGHPKYNKHADDIDYQIEADFAGLIAPGMPNVAIGLGEKFGRLMNYGDGLYGGQLVGGMYAAAFFEDDPVRIVEAGLRCIPPESQYAECIRDVLAWHRQQPDDWEATWKRINDKYQLNPAYRRFSCGGPKSDFNIDAKINGAYIVMGLLYGERDLDKTILIATRCGQDSDCNPSNAGGVLFTTIGRSKLPARFTSELNEQEIFSHTAYNFARLVEVCDKLARQAVLQQGGKIEQQADGSEVFVIPVVAPKPSKLEQCWEPGPAAEVRFTEEEMEKITALSGQKKLQADLEKVAPGWKLADCGPDMEPGLRAEHRGAKNVFMTHPLNREVGCTLSKEVDVPKTGTTVLRMVVANDARGDFTLVVRAAGEELFRKKIGPESSPGGWSEATVDLSQFAGKTVPVEIVNLADGWQYEAAYWAKIAVQTQ